MRTVPQKMLFSEIFPLKKTVRLRTLMNLQRFWQMLLRAYADTVERQQESSIENSFAESESTGRINLRRRRGKQKYVEVY